MKSLAEVAIDGHAHFYDAHDPGRWLDAAWWHMAPAGQAGLILAQTARARSPSQLAARLGGTGWTATATDEPESLAVTRQGGGRLLLIGGYQVATRERAEVLSLGVPVADGTPLVETVGAVVAGGGLAILPWGFGKWRMLSSAVLESLTHLAGNRLLLGDNRGRPQALPPSWPFRWARRRGIAVLPGSDPLPLADHAAWPGSYGFVLPGRLDEARPAADLRQRLMVLSGQPRPFGGRVSLAGFCLDQVRLRTAARTGGFAHAA